MNLVIERINTNHCPICDKPYYSKIAIDQDPDIKLIKDSNISDKLIPICKEHKVCI